MLRQEIKLKGELFQKVLTGEKTCTTRLGVKDYRLDLCTHFVDPKDHSRIIDIEPYIIMVMPFQQAIEDHEIYQNEGYTNRIDYEDAVRNCYENIKSTDMVTVVKYMIVG